MKLLSKLADTAVNKMLGKVEAGACVPTVGNCCTTPHYSVSCTGPCVKDAYC